MRRLAVFVDAGYFWEQTVVALFGTRQEQQGLFTRKISRDDVALDYSTLRAMLIDAAEREFVEASLLRVYWYDGPSKNGKAEDHRAVEYLDDFKLRLGARNRVGQQKAVDGLIIADLIGLAQNRAITDALIVSGDADLTPGVVAAQGLGLRVHLLGIGSTQSTSPMLRVEVDRKSHWSEWNIFSYASAKYDPGAVATSSTAQASEQAESPVQSAGEAVSGSVPQVRIKKKATNEAAVAQAATESAPQALSPDTQGEKSGATADADPGVHNEMLLRIAQDCLGQLGPTEVESARQGRGLPKEVDRKLLLLARRYFGAHIEEADRHTLRAHLKTLVQDAR